ncbi:MAG TPA: sigma-54 dependent transcriptional regulator [Rhodocyclaceae bacterium]
MTAAHFDPERRGAAPVNEAVKTEQATVLVVDDDPDLLHLIGLRLTTAGYRVASAASGEQALELFHAHAPRAVITDLRMEGMDGLALFEKLHAEAPSLPVIILTAHGSIPEAVRATQRGVFGFLTKPFEGRDLLERVASAVALSSPLKTGSADATALGGHFASAAMNELQRQARRIADGDEPVLIMGPDGAGKEAVARAIHDAGRRADKPFVALRGGELPGGRAGEDAPLAQAIVDVAGGTLFIDDVDKLLPGAQVRLLPLVRDLGLFSVLGKPKENANVRVVAATAQPLNQAIRAGHFRADLYYALSRNVLTVPALADRREDIPLLVAQFVAAAPANAELGPRSFAPDALALLQHADWHGNVRQLRNVVEQALSHSVTPQVPASLVQRLLSEENEREMEAFDEARRAFEYDYLVQLLRTTGGNVARAARVARRNRTEFYKLLARHGLDPGAFKRAGT